MDGAYNPEWINRSSRTAPPPRCPPAAHWNNPVPFRSSLSLYTLPLSRRRRRTDSLLLSLSPTVLPPSVSSVHYWDLSLFRSLGRLLFSVSLVDDSPFDPLCDNGMPRSRLLLLASLSSIVGLRAPCAFVLVAPSDRRWFSVFFFHQVPPAPFSFPLTVPSLPRAERQKGRGRNRSLSSPFLSIPLRSPLGVLHPVLSSHLPSSFSLSFTPISSTFIRDILSVLLSRAAAFRFLASR